MYLTMYLSKKLYFMVISERGRETERPSNMIIIFGNGPKYFIEAEGKFICPNCNFIKRYLVKTSKDYFRLFFIPLIPAGEKSQPFVECQHCKSNWHTSVLDQNNYYLDGTPVTK